MAKEFVRFAYDGAPLIPVEQPPAPAKAIQPPNIATSHAISRTALVESHGEGIGGALYELELQTRRKGAEQWQVLRERATELRRQRDQFVKDGESRLAELEHNMNAQRDSWLRACTAYEAQRLKIQHATAPLDHEIADIQRQLSRPLYEGRVKQWDARPDLAPRAHGTEP